MPLPAAPHPRSTTTKLLDLLEYYLRWRQELPGGQGMQCRCGAGGGRGTDLPWPLLLPS